MRPLFVAVSLILSLAGCGHPNCKNMCDKLKSCGFSSSGVSCDEKCSDTDAKCADCVNANACADLPSKCASSCPTGPFGSKK